jgi:glycosyltransferase involved in cell wall biosynthesis
MNVWLITAFEPIPTDKIRPMRFMGIADQLIKNGHKVTIWTSTYTPHNNKHRFPEDKFIEWTKNYNLAILKSMGYNKKISLQRYFAHLDFSRRLKNEMPRAPKPDIIYISLPPIDTVVEVVKYSHKRQVPVVVDIIDPWPDVFLRLLPTNFWFLGKLFLFPFYYQIKYIFSNVQGVVAISDTYRKWALRHASKPIPSATFYPAVELREQSQEPPKSKRANQLQFVYAGSLSTSYDVATIVKVARRLSDEGCTVAKFVIAGQGPQLESLKKEAFGLKNILFTGFLGGAELNKLLNNSDVGIACYVKNTSQSVTYKLFDYLSAGLPIICSLPGEMAEIIIKNGVGYYFEPEDPSEMYSVVVNLIKNRTKIAEMKVNALELTRKLGDSKIVYGNLAKFLEQICYHG